MARVPATAVVLVVVLLGALAGAAAAALARETRTEGLRLLPVVKGLSSPVLVTAPPGAGGVVYVVEQGGLVKVVRRGVVQPTPFLDVRRLVESGGEQGLLGLAFAPDYAQSREFVVDYTDADGNTRVVRYRSDGTKAVPSSATVLLTVDQPYANHNGGMVAYGKDGKLYVGMGDGGSGGDPEDRAQDPSSLLGKILRLDPKRPTAKPVIVALGVRNPWRFSFDRRNGDLWIGDVGQNSIEEIDHVAWPWSGLLNFGWNVYEGRSSYERKPLGPGRLVRPVAQYTHALGCSVTGGYVYRGTAVPAAKGRYFYGDYCSGTIWSLVLSTRGRPSGPRVRKEPFRVPTLTSFGEDGVGELYAVSGNGTVYRLAG